MGVAHIIGEAATPLRDIGPRQPLLHDDRIILFGYEREEQEPFPLRALEARQITDVVDATELPLADFPHFNAGLSLDEAMACLNVFLQFDKLAGMLLPEINPDHDPGRQYLPGLVARIAGAFSAPER